MEVGGWGQGVVGVEVGAVGLGAVGFEVEGLKFLESASFSG